MGIIPDPATSALGPDAPDTARAVARLRAFVAADPKTLAERMPHAGDIVAAQQQVREVLAAVDASGAVTP